MTELVPLKVYPLNDTMYLNWAGQKLNILRVIVKTDNISIFCSKIRFGIIFDSSIMETSEIPESIFSESQVEYLS